MFRRRKIITRGLIGNMPDAIELDIEHLKIGQFIYIKDLDQDGCEFLAPDNAVVVGVKTARAAIEEEVEEDQELEGEEGETTEGGESKSEGDETKQESPTEEPATE